MSKRIIIELNDPMDRANWNHIYSELDEHIDMLDHWETCVEGMDDELREQCHMEVCMGGIPENDNAAFLSRYLELHLKKYGEDYRI